jgi:hypothetical protein
MGQVAINIEVEYRWPLFAANFRDGAETVSK